MILTLNKYVTPEFECNCLHIIRFSSILVSFFPQVAGWILIACFTIVGFLIVCIPRYCSPHSLLHLNYWVTYLENEGALFHETSNKHSQLYALKHIKKFFGFTPEEKQVKKIYLPTRKDWRIISGIDMFTKLDQESCQYSLLHMWADEATPRDHYTSVDDVVVDA